ncbi:hypothetical protein ACHMW7_13830 [Aminobacter sp. UC22_36]|uniref:hypothetical protein n=1 Tax=Aminobacter sp. UC22_36 TaxID=3374549 RepID=UPI00375645D6
MEPESAPAKRRANRHFSHVALLGSVFAGLWTGATVLILPNAESISELPSHAAAIVLSSMFIAIFWIIPVSAVVGAVVYVLARVGRDHRLPGFVGVMGLGAAVGLMIGLLPVVLDIFDGGAVSFVSFAIVPAGIVGGVVGGAAYRVLLVYRYPNEGHDRQGGLV